MTSTARQIVTVTALAALAVSGCTDSGETTNPSGFVGDGILAAGALQPFEECDALLEHLQTEALERVTPYGVQGMNGGGHFFAVEESVAADGAGADTATAQGERSQSAPAPEPGVDFSETNTQEAGIDEPDIVKTDGRTIFVVNQGELAAIDVTGAAPRILDTMTLDEEWGWGAQLLRDGDRLLVTGTRWGGMPGRPMPMERGMAADMAYPGGGYAISLVQLVDASNPSDLELLSTLEVDGTILSARTVGGHMHLALRSEPTGLQFVYPEEGGIRGEEEAEQRNREIIEQSTIDDWLPWVVETTGSQTREGRLHDCSAVHRPVEFAGFGALSILSIDPQAPRLSPDDTVAVLAGGETVYASQDRFVVATTRWFDWETMDEDERRRVEEQFATDLHSFDLTLPTEVRYVASGTVPGTLLNQFALSEHEGYLRAATTRGTPWGPGANSDSVMTVLEERDGELATVGSVGGLGKGERIYSVRFIGDRAYVVTFRQVDPLYTIDLSNPSAPAVEGELKILGYSSYLHPIGEDLLLGIGQDATEQGRTTGTQIAVFDVSDPENPTRRHQHTIAGASSEAEYDHHAFLWWGPTNNAILPLQIWDHMTIEEEPVPVEPEPDAPATGESTAGSTGSAEAEPAPPQEEPARVAPPQKAPFIGAIAFDVDPESGITEEARLSHQLDNEDPWAYQAQIRRSLVIGDTVWTISEERLVGYRLSDFTEAGRIDL